MKGVKYGIHGSDSKTRGFFLLMEKTIFLVRHGETDGNKDRRFIGSTDLPLNSEGREQVSSLKPLTSKLGFSRCICSPFLRCRETAGILLQDSSPNFYSDERIKDADFGKWEGLTFTEISASYPEDVRRLMAFDDDFAFPQGETLHGFLARIRSFALDINDYRDDRILLVTHGGIIRFLLCHWLQLEPRHHVIFDVALAALTTVKLYSGKGILAALNERMAP